MLSWNARRRTPLRMAPPPRQEGREGLSPVRRLCTRKASTSSRVLRLDTRLGEISWRDLVRVAKASRPETARPGGDRKYDVEPLQVRLSTCCLLWSYVEI